MVKINKIYTRSGDGGETGLVGGHRVPKECARVEAYGEIDELNSFLGKCRTLAIKNSRSDLTEKLAEIQNDLFDLGSELATAPEHKWPGMIEIAPNHTKKLEDWIDQLVVALPELRSFVLPGGTELNAEFHIARAVCRRAERSILRLSRTESVSSAVITFVNRLSDLLFAMARYESHCAKTTEFLWKPGGQ